MHGDFRESLVLVKNGVPFDVAFSMSRKMRRAAIIVLGEIDGGRWNWDSMSWIEDR